MHPDKDLQSLYLTEVTKKDIMSGLSKLKDMKVYLLEYENELPSVKIDSLAGIFKTLEERVSYNIDEEIDEDHVTKELISGKMLTFEFLDDMYWVQIFVSINKNDIRGVLQSNLNDINICLSRLN